MNNCYGPLSLVPFFGPMAVSYTHLRAHATMANLVCRLVPEKKQTDEGVYRMQLKAGLTIARVVSRRCQLLKATGKETQFGK